jgi:hypothetical protein
MWPKTIAPPVSRIDLSFTTRMLSSSYYADEKEPHERSSSVAASGPLAGWRRSPQPSRLQLRAARLVTFFLAAIIVA